MWQVQSSRISRWPEQGLRGSRTSSPFVNSPSCPAALSSSECGRCRQDDKLLMSLRPPPPPLSVKLRAEVIPAAEARRVGAWFSWVSKHCFGRQP